MKEIEIIILGKEEEEDITKGRDQDYNYARETKSKGEIREDFD